MTFTLLRSQVPWTGEVDDQVSDLAIGLRDDRMVEKESEVRFAGHVAKSERHQSHILSSIIQYMCRREN